MDFLKSDKAAILLIFQGKAFQMTGLNYFIEFYSKWLVLIIGTQNSDFKRSCAELLSIT